jgi:hypothetical protein
VLTGNFWVLYSLLDPALIEDTHLLQDYLPDWMNHSLHSYVLGFTAAELLLCFRHYPRWTALGRLMSTFVVLAYASWWVRRHFVLAWLAERVMLQAFFGTKWPSENYSASCV